MHRGAIFLIFILFSTTAFAQFNNFGFGDEGGGVFGNSSTENDTISATQLFSIKDYFRGLAHKDTIKMSWVFGGSIVLPGSAQIYNKDYWKLPIFYTGIGGFASAGVIYNKKYKSSGNQHDKTISTICFASAAAFYWASIMDGVSSYKSDKEPDPTRATLYSVLLPGLGQVYNQDYWHIPLWYTGLAFSAYAWTYNGKQYTRYRDLYNWASEPNSTYTGSVSKDNLKHYRDTFRRMRDYSILATAAVYLLQAIDAYVFAVMHDFEISDDLSLDLAPTIITPIGAPNLNYNLASQSNNSFGLQLNFKF